MDGGVSCPLDVSFIPSLGYGFPRTYFLHNAPPSPPLPLSPSLPPPTHPETNTPSSLSVPILGTSILGLGMISASLSIQTYIVDAFPLYAASATAAIAIWRSIVGALLPLAGLPMYQRLGVGWGNSLLGFIAVALVPVPLLLLRYGERVRTNPRWEVRL